MGFRDGRVRQSTGENVEVGNHQLEVLPTRRRGGCLESLEIKSQAPKGENYNQFQPSLSIQPGRYMAIVVVQITGRGYRCGWGGSGGGGA